MKIKIVNAGVGEGHPKKKCSFCNKKLKKDEAVATCTHTEYVTLCPKCYSAAGNNVR